MSLHRYLPQKLLPDYLRGAAGLAISAGLCALAPNVTAVVVIFGALALLFGLFMLQTVQKQMLMLEMTEDRIGKGSDSAYAKAWGELEALRLRYYALRRNKPGGWMALRLDFPGQRIGIDSNIEGFEEIVARAARAARDQRLEMDDTTRANLAAIGHAAGAGLQTERLT
ncbi:MAG TPA: hypothetical protein VFZ07_05255 [Dongiaceae bacterium]